MPLGSFAGTPPRDEIERELERIFMRPEFKRSKNFLDRFVDWISDLLRELFGGGSNAGAWGGPALNLVIWLVIIVLAVAVVGLVVVVIRKRVRRDRGDDDDFVLVLEEERSMSEWRSAAEQFERDGRWKEAMRCRFRELLAVLIDRDVVSLVPGRTTGELRRDLAASVPHATATFDEATLLFELPWFADRPTGPDENRRFRMLAGEVLAAAPAHGGADSRRIDEMVGARS